MKLLYMPAETGAYEENLRIQAWHATFNAALTGLLAGWNGIATAEAALNARSTADFVHGSIEAK